MATGPTWTAVADVIASGTISAGATSTGNVDLATSNYDAANIQADITDSGSASVTVNIYGSNDGGTTVDSTAILSFQTDGSGTRDARTIPVLGHTWIQVEVVNNDGSNATGTVHVTERRRQWSSSV